MHDMQTLDKRQFRAAEPGEPAVRAAVLEITRAAFLINPETGLRIEGDTPDELPMVQTLFDRGAVDSLHTATVDSAAAGCVLYTEGTLTGNPGARPPGLTIMGVAPDRQRRGIGTGLLKWSVARLHASGGSMAGCLLALCAFSFADTLTVVSVGDVMFAGKGTRWLDSLGVHYPMAHVRDELSRADLRICNLEMPIADAGVAFDKTFTFRAPVRHAGVLLDAGFDVAHLGNNHVMDNGVAAFESTLRVLDSLGIAHVAAGMTLAEARRPAILERKGVKIGVLGYSLTYPEEFWADSARPGTVFGDSTWLRDDITALRNQVDYLFVIFHWGAEKMTTPKDYQKALGRLSIDLGADAVFGHHPHVLQGIELYKGKIIAYSLGNFSFASWTNAVWDSAILRLYFLDRALLKAEVVPLNINNFQVEFQTRILKGPAARRSLSALARQCRSLRTTLRIQGDRGWIVP